MAMPARPRFALARLTHEVRVKPGLTRFLPAILRTAAAGSIDDGGDGELAGSVDIAGTSRSNCFLVVNPDQPLLPAGETVTILLA